VSGVEHGISMPDTLSGIVDENKENPGKVYPNPFVNFIIIEFHNDKKEKYTLTLYNTNGQLVHTINEIISERVKIETKKLTSGLYFYQIRNDKEFVIAGKLIRE